MESSQDFHTNLYPNPTTGDAMLAFELPMDQPFMIRVFDMSGRLVYDRKEIGTEGENTQPINLGGIAAGIYIVDFKSENLNVRKRLMIQQQ